MFLEFGNLPRPLYHGILEGIEGEEELEFLISSFLFNTDAIFSPTSLHLCIGMTTKKHSYHESHISYYICIWRTKGSP